MVRFRFLAEITCAAAVAAGACHADPISIVQSLALSGPLSSYGEAKRAGAAAYIDQVNRQGGVNGRLIKVTVMDDGYDPKRTVANLKSMVSEQRPSAILGLFGVPTIAAALPIIEELRIPTVGLTTGSIALRVPSKRYIFPVRASYADEATSLMRHLKLLNLTAVTLIQQDNAFGSLVRDAFVSAAQQNGIKVSQVMLRADASDAVTVTKTALAQGGDAVFLSMLSGAAIPTIRSIRSQAKSAIPLYAISATDASILIRDLGVLAAGLIVSQVVPAQDSSKYRISMDYTKSLAANAGGAPSFYGLEAFIEAKILVEALKLAGDAVGDPEAVTRALERLVDYDVGGLNIRFSKDAHQGASFVDLMMIGSKGTVIR